MIKKILLCLGMLSIASVFAINGLLNYQGAWVSGTIYHQRPLQGSNKMLLPVVTNGGASCVLVAESQLNVNESPNSQPTVWDCNL